MKPARLDIYFGSPEDDPLGTYLYLELVIPGVAELELRASGRLDEQGDRDSLEEFQSVLNMAALAIKALNVPIHIDMEGIHTGCVELGLSEETITEIKKLVKEFRQDLKGGI